MALSQPVQNGLGDVQRELLTSRYSVAAPVDPVLPGTKTTAPKAEEKHAFASQDWFERTTDKADGGRTALKNLLTRMKGLADAAEQRQAAERVSATPEAKVEPEEGLQALPPASMFVPPPASWAATTGAAPAPAPATAPAEPATPPPPPSTGGSTGGNTPNGQGQGGGLIGKLFGG
jgi:hypothetical protein